MPEPQALPEQRESPVPEPAARGQGTAAPLLWVPVLQARPKPEQREQEQLQEPKTPVRVRGQVAAWALEPPPQPEPVSPLQGAVEAQKRTWGEQSPPDEPLRARQAACLRSPEQPAVAPQYSLEDEAGERSCAVQGLLLPYQAQPVSARSRPSRSVP